MTFLFSCGLHCTLLFSFPFARPFDASHSLQVSLVIYAPAPLYYAAPPVIDSSASVDFPPVGSPPPTLFDTSYSPHSLVAGLFIVETLPCPHSPNGYKLNFSIGPNLMFFPKGDAEQVDCFPGFLTMPFQPSGEPRPPPLPLPSVCSF